MNDKSGPKLGNGLDINSLYALIRYSNIQSGSPFNLDISLTTSRVKPLPVDATVAAFVLKPYL